MLGLILGEFAVGPGGAVGEVLFFPDGDGLFECYEEAAGFEGGGAVGGGDHKRIG